MEIQTINLKPRKSDSGNFFSFKVSKLIIALSIFLGLGSIYKVPSYIAEFGGSFLLIFAILTILVGFPLLILATNMGKRYRFSVIELYKNFNRKFTWIGLIQVGISIIILITLFAVLAWSGIGFIQSCIPNFFQNNSNLIINSQNQVYLNAIDWKVILAGLFSIVLVFLSMYIGIKKGHLKLLPLLGIISIAILLGLIILIATLPTGSYGLDYLFNINQKQLHNIGAWRAGFGQVLFMFGAGSGAMITFNKYASKNTEINNALAITSLVQIVLVIIVNIIIFSILSLDYKNISNPVISFSQWVQSSQINSLGFNFIFHTLPAILGAIAIKIGILSNVLGALIFALIFITTLIAATNFLNVIFDNLKEQFPNKKGFLNFCLLPLFYFAFICLAATNLGPAVIDSLDFWIKQNFIMIVTIAECLILMFWMKVSKPIKEYGDVRSIYPVSIIWEIFIGIAVPLGIAIVFVIGLFKGTFATQMFAGNTAIFYTILACGILLTLLLLISGYISARKYTKHARAIKAWSYVILPFLLLFVFFVVTFKFSVSFHNHSETVQLISIAIMAILGLLIPLAFLYLSEKGRSVN